MEFTRLCGQKLSRNDQGLRQDCSAAERLRDRAGVIGNLNGNLWPQEGGGLSWHGVPQGHPDLRLLLKGKKILEEF